MDTVMHKGRPLLDEEVFTRLRLEIEKAFGYRPELAADALNQALACVAMVARQHGDWYLSVPVDNAYSILRENFDLYGRIARRLGAYVRRVPTADDDLRDGTAADLEQTYERLRDSALPAIPGAWRAQEPAPAFLVARRVIKSHLPVAI